MNKVLIAVLSTRHEPWGTMIETSKNTWDSIYCENCDTIYYVGSPESDLVDRVKGLKVDDKIENIMDKNMMFFKWALTLDWDIMFRVNASTYVHKERLIDYCEHIPLNGLVRGKTCPDLLDRPWLVGGGGMLFSRDVVQAFADNENKASKSLPEDVALSFLAQDLGFSIGPKIPCCTISNDDGTWMMVGTIGYRSFTDFHEPFNTDVFAFRVNQSRGDRGQNRHMDKYCMEQLFKCQND